LFNARSVANKLSELQHLLYCDNYDIMFITETWLHDDIPNGLLDPKLSYNIIRKDRTMRKGGGVCAFVSKRWDVVPVALDSRFADIEVVCFDCLIRGTGKRVRFFIIYRPPSYDCMAVTHMSLIIDCLSTYESTNHCNIIVGDLNLPKINWATMSCPNDNIHKPFLSFAIESSYSQLISFPTHDNNILDLILCPDPSMIGCVKPVVPFGASDHDMILFNVIVTNKSCCSFVQDPCCVYNWQSADYDAIERYLSNFDWYNLVTMFPDASALWDAFKSILYDAVDWYVPKYQHNYRNSTKLCSRLPCTLRKCLAEKRCLWRKLRLNKHDTLIRSKYRDCVHNWHFLIRQRQMQVEGRLIDKNSLGLFYKFVNKRTSNRTDIGPIISQDNITITDDYDKACAFNDYFTSVGRPDNGVLPPCTNKTTNILDSVDVNEFNVLCAINRMKSGFSSGPDGLPAVFFKRLQYTVAKPLSIIFHQLLSVAYVPDDWKKALITPVYKKGPQTDCSNYRPISITCVTSKILERVICCQVREHLVNNNLLHYTQHGFTTGRSTCTNLLESFNDWTLCFQDKQQVSVVYIDFSKAFDVVSHNKLFARLQSYGIAGSLLSWLCNFYSGRTHCTKVGTTLSDISDVISGVIQGSAIGPLMFLAYLNELAEILANFGIKVNFFADDVKVYARITNDVDRLVLQEAVDALYSWAKDWQLSISVEKCCLLNIGQRVTDVSVSIDSTVLPVVNSCRDLGIIVTSDLSPSSHVNSIVAKAHARANAIHRCFVSRNTNLLVRAYLVYVRPLLEYNSVIWSPHLKQDIDAIERVQRRFTKRLRGFGNYTYSERLHLLKLPSLELRRLHTDLIWCYKIIFGLVALIPSDFFQFRVSSVTRGHPYKILKPHSCCTARASFFAERIVNIWNSLPHDSIDFSSLHAFKHGIEELDFSMFLCLY